LKKSICIVTPSFNGGGAERVAVNLANYYAEIGHNVSIIAFKAAGPYANQVSERVMVIDLNSRARYVFFKLLNALRARQPGLVLSVIRDANIFVGLSSYFIRARIIFREANTMNAVASMPTYKKFLFIFLMRHAYKRADKVIANSNDTKQDLLKNNIVSAEKTQVIGNPVLAPNFENLVEQELTHCWLGNREYKTILNVGRLHKLKNQYLLIKAFGLVHAKLPNSRLVVLGVGEEKDKLIALIGELGLKDVVEIIPFQQNPYPYYKAADVFVLTSDWEGFGNVIVEAMASETAVISTNCPGGPKMILNNGEFGVLVEPNNAQKLADAIKSELENPSSLEQIAKSKQRAMEFSLEQVATRYLEKI
jgi:glycosyltransferase involved in cell wall biosynthesis